MFLASDVHNPSQLDAFNETFEFRMPDKELRYEYESEVSIYKNNFHLTLARNRFK